MTKAMPTSRLFKRVLSAFAFLLLATAIPRSADAQPACPTQVELHPRAHLGAATTTTRLDTGWTALGHERDIPEGHNLTMGITCPNTNAPCGVCSIDGLVEPVGRCSNNRTIECQQINAADAACGGSRCDWFIFAPNPGVFGGSPACFQSRLTSNIAGTVDPASGSFSLSAPQRFDVYLGISISQPCPTCVGDITLNDGVRAGVCSGGDRNGLGCDANARDLTFGDMSVECPPSPGTLITGTGVQRSVLLGTGASSLGYGLPCDPPFSGANCPCGVCSADPTVACASDADCTALGLGTCTGVAPNSPSRQPNQCDASICLDTGDSTIGSCGTGPDENYCDGFLHPDGEPIVPCISNADCQAQDPNCPGGDCGNCTISKRRACFLDPIQAQGSASTTQPVLAGIWCVGPATNVAVNSVLGLPGAERLRLVSDFVGAVSCPVVDNCPAVDNPDQLNSDCPDPTYLSCVGCSGTVPAQFAGCCDGGDACDPCPAYADNTRCDPAHTASGSFGTSGGVLNTVEPSGTVSATLSIPAGALSSNTTISVTENLPGTQPAPGTTFSTKEPNAIADVLSVSVRPEGLAFNSPIQVTLRWDDRDKDALVDRGTCNGGSDNGLPCDHDMDCNSLSCSVNANVSEADLILKRNNSKFSKGGFGVTPFKCSDHLSGSGCETATANCSDAAGTGKATVAKCCDPGAGPSGTRTYGEWTFLTCDFSEFLVGLDASALVPGKGSPKTDCGVEWAPHNPLNEEYLDKKGLPNFDQVCRDGDAICDRDGVADGRCTFELGMCLNVDDPRLVKKGVVQCTPSDTASWSILKPKTDASDPTDQANAQALAGAALSLGSGTLAGDVLTYNPAVTETAACSQLVQVVVPLNDGEKAKKTLKMRTESSSGRKDTDTLKLTCLPPESSGP